MKMPLILVLALAFLTSTAGGSNEQPEIPASIILEEIKMGLPVEHANVTVKGDINLRNLDLPRRHLIRNDFEKNISISENMRLIDSPIRINDCRIEGYVNFDNALFNQTVNFERTTFDKEMVLSDVKCMQNINFKDTKFNDLIIFQSSFNNLVDFRDSIFYGNVKALNSYFNKMVDFRRSKFNNEFILGGAKKGVYFNGEVDFSDSMYAGESYLINNTFHDNIFLSNAIFGKGAHFDDSKFDAFADFSTVAFEGIALFPKAVFNENAAFQSAHFANIANFRGAKFKGVANFGQTEFGSASDFREATFDNELNFTGVYFPDITINWQSIKDNLVCGGFTYQVMIKNFRDRGQFEDARDCYYRYRLLKMIDRSSIDAYYIMDYLSWGSCGFGVRPEFVIFWSILLIAFCTIFLFFKGCIYIYRSDSNIGKIRALDNKRNKRIPLKKVIYFNLLVFFHSMAHEDLRVSGYCKYLVTIEEILGWFLQGIFLIVLLNVFSTW